MPKKAILTNKCNFERSLLSFHISRKDQKTENSGFNYNATKGYYLLIMDLNLFTRDLLETYNH